MSKNLLVEKYVPVIKLQGGYNSKLPITTTGAITGGSIVNNGALTVTSTSATALAVGANGTTNPQFNVDDSTASVATGINIKGAAAGSGVTLSAISSGTNENLTVNAKGSGTLNFNASGGFSVFGGNVGVSSTSANALAVGAANVTNPTLNVDSSTASVATGLNIKGAAAGSGVALSVISSGTNESMTINGKGTGTVTVQSAVAVPAGGSAAGSLLMSSTAALGVYFGSGAPTVSAAQGSVYIRTDGSSTSTRLYINTNGSTTWTNVTTAA